ncbi:DUF2188 domain-containing protein [Cupriavidus sp. KK10]|uniref:DUF2188 domain-containing protein n=1 Tax=Cupriavidus sp. KK10 TaxID=1478019 RepID=UPI001BAA2541|nr:DUF2188 domain-containing protein [Cupriavidus sp. KK10]QUN28688.1 DUF2188 domain-containing protein [Cupriavidus sp. KK10]
MPGQNIHVVPAGDGWAVEIEGGHGKETYDTQAEAIAAGTEKAKQMKVELFIHGLDGQIRERNSFGNDPRDIPG